MDQIIKIETEINEETMSQVIDELQSSKGPMKIFISSPGGNIYDGLAIYDAIREYSQFNGPVTTIAYGLVASMAFILFLAGDKRIGSANVTLMNHKGYGGADGDADSLILDAKEIKRIEDICNQIIADRTGYKTKNFWTRHIAKGNQYYDIIKARKYGIINN